MPFDGRQPQQDDGGEDQGQGLHEELGQTDIGRAVGEKYDRHAGADNAQPADGQKTGSRPDDNADPNQHADEQQAQPDRQ